MNLSHTPDLAFVSRRVGCGVAEQHAEQFSVIDACVEALGECAEVAAGLPAEIECLVGAANHFLEVAGQGVDSNEPGHLIRLARAQDEGRSQRRGLVDQRISLVERHEESAEVMQ